MILKVTKGKRPASDKSRAQWLAAMMAGANVSPRKLVECLETIDGGGSVDIALDPAVAAVIGNLAIGSDLFTVEVIWETSDFSDDPWSFTERDFDDFLLMKRGAEGDAAAAIEFCRKVLGNKTTLRRMG